MKRMKKICTLLFAVLILLSFAGCKASLSSGDLIGVWSGSTEYNGHYYNESIEFKRDGTFFSLTYCDNSLSESKKGTYTIEGNEVKTTHFEPYEITMYYKYNNGKLTNGGYCYSKEDN